MCQYVVDPARKQFKPSTSDVETGQPEADGKKFAKFWYKNMLTPWSRLSRFFYFPKNECFLRRFGAIFRPSKKTASKFIALFSGQ